jgi:hypothetical protein
MIINERIGIAVAVTFCTETTAFTVPSARVQPTHSIGRNSNQHFAESESSASTTMAESIDTSTSANGSAANGLTRYSGLLSEVGMGSTDLKSLEALPGKRPVSVDDVFCNRELNLETIRAIGFDMDYTLAQYKQPAFDKLAFDGAKEKLVKILGYPEELLDAEYDHTVGNRIAQPEES